MRVGLLNNLKAMFNDIAEDLEREAADYGEFTKQTCDKLLDAFSKGKAPIMVLTDSGSGFIFPEPVWLELIHYSKEMGYCE